MTIYTAESMFEYRESVVQYSTQYIRSIKRKNVKVLE